MNSNDLKNKLLNNSDKVMDKLLYLLSGKDDAVINPWEREAINTLYPTLHNIMVNTADLKKISAESTKDITGALCRGKISVDEALKLMSVLKVKSDIEDLPDMLAKLTELKK